MFQKGYRVELSNKSVIQIDADEVELVLKSVAAGKPVKVRQGIINPSYIVCVTEDRERREKFLEDMRHEPRERLMQGMQPLKDILTELPIHKQLT